MTPGQRSDYRRLPRIARWRREPRHRVSMDQADYIPEDWVSTWVTSTSVGLAHQPTRTYPRRVSYVPVPWSYFDSADRYLVQS